MNRTLPLALALTALTLAFTQIPAALAQDPGGFLVVTNKGDRTLSIVDTAARREVATIPEDGITGHEVATSPDGKRAFVPIFGNSGVGKPGTDGQVIQVMDLAQRKIVETIDFKRGVRPHHPVYNAATNKLLVTTEVENSVSIINPVTLKVEGSVPTDQPESHMLAVSSDGKRGYTANVGPGTVSILDLEAKKLIKVLPVAKRVQRITVTPDDKWAITADQISPRLAFIDTAKNEVTEWVDLPDIAYGTAATPDGRYLVIALINLNEVGVLDLQAKKLVRTFQVPKSPQAVVVRPDGAEAYVSCDASGQIAVIDLKAMKLAGTIPVGKMADGMAWAAMPLK